FDLNSVYDVENITHWNGKRHGLLIQLNVNTGVYNRSVFQENGVKEPTPNWTWDDHLAAAKQLTQSVDNRWGTSSDHNYPYEWFWSANVPYMDAKGTKTYWDRPASREILQWIADLVLRWRVTPSPREASEKKLNFQNGNYAIGLRTVPSPAITERVDGKFDWLVLPTPKHPQTKKGVVLVTGHNYLVTTKARERGVLTESVQVLVELYNKEVQDLYSSGLSLGSFPILKSVAAQAGKMSGMPSNFALALDAIPSGKNFDKVVGFLDFHRAFGPEFAKALNGEVSVEQAAVNMTVASDAALQQAAR
ncbi:MAG: hypothetical protein ACRDI2_09215, partial [Chloroflexota bacterium]